MNSFLKKGIILTLMPFFFYSFAFSVEKKELSSYEIELSAVIEYFSREMQRTIVPDDNILNSLKARKARIILPPNNDELISDPEHWRLIFDNILSIYGYTLIEKGSDSNGKSILRLIQKKDAIKTPTPFYSELGEGGELKNTSEEIITQVIVMKHTVTDVVRPMFRYISQITPPLTLPDKKTMIVTAHESDLKYFLNLVRLIDVKKDKPYSHVYYLKQSDVNTVKNHIQSYFNVLRARKKGAVDQATQAFMLPDEATNRLFVSAIEEDHKVIENFVQFFEEKVENPIERRPIQIYRLKNSDAEHVAKKLDQILKAKRTTSAKNKKTQEDIPTIVPYKELNALIISVEKKETFNAVKEVIELIDVKRNQVFLSSTIVEVQHSNDFDFATDFGFRVKPQQGKLGVFGGSALGAGTPTVDLTDPNNAILSITPNQGNFSLAVPFGQYNVIPFVLNASKTNSDLNVIANPSVICDDNEKASIRITEERAFTQSTIGTGGQQSVSHGGFHEAGIVLNITPTISSDNFLRLVIEQNVDRFIPSDDGRDIRNKREVSITVTIPNKTSVVIGGLTQEQNRDEASKVPGIGDIPLLGKLFQKKGNAFSRSTLYFFITPEIISNFDQMAGMSDQFHDAITEQANQGLRDNKKLQQVKNNRSGDKTAPKKKAVKKKTQIDVLKTAFVPVNIVKWVHPNQYLDLASDLMTRHTNKELKLLPPKTEEYFVKDQLDDVFFMSLENAKTYLDTLSLKERNAEIIKFNEYLVNALGELAMRGKHRSGKRYRRTLKNKRKSSEVIDVPLPK